MTPEAPKPPPDKETKPWQRIIVCGPGAMEEIRKAGEDARKEEGEIEKEITVKIDKTNEPKK
jgi:hypothetical protein